MAAYKGANVTKYDAGGSGDNIIADGYIKTVEKVWMDTFTFTGTVLSTADTIAIASIPPNKKITGVEVYIPASLTPTTATINVGISGDADKFIDDGRVVDTVGASGAMATSQVVRMNNPDGFQFVTTSTTNTTIYLSIGVIALTAPTTGTITTIVRYT
jgi:hypothetical protein